MLTGLVLVGAAGLGLRSELRSSSSPSEENPTATGCEARACRANADARPARGYEVPSVVVDPADPDHVVVVDVNLVGGACGWHVTFDGGRAWEDGTFALPPGFRRCELDSGGFLPLGNAVMGPSGAVYAVLSSARLGEDGRAVEGESVLLVRSGDGGRTFGPATVAVPGGPPEVTWLRPAMTAAADPSGSDRLLLSFWGCRPPADPEPGLCDRAVFSQSLDGGQTFAPPVVVNDAPAGFSPSPPVLAAGGAVYVTFLRRFSDGVADVLLARSADGGATFAVSPVERQPQVGLRYDSAKLATAPDGGVLYIVYQDNRAGDPDVWFRRSVDQGGTWSEPVRLNSDGEGASYLPRMSVSADGRIDVVFYQRRLQDVDDVQWTFSTDGGQSFARDLQLNDAGIDRLVGYWNEVGDSYPPAVASGSGTAYVAWSDSAAGNRGNDTQDTLLRLAGAG